MSDASATERVFPGDRIGTHDPRYPTMVRGFNLRWVGEPLYVQVCGDTAQVVRTVQQAVDEGLRITVRCGGHCYEDFVCDNHGGVIIDLSPMNGVFHDRRTGLYCVEGGATLWDTYTRLYRQYGVTIPGGSCYSVGAGGHVTGGGYGLLSRLHGLTIDHLRAVEVVHVNRDHRVEAITVSRDSTDPEERELLWAHLGGGGGNFGIVTKFWFADPPRAPTQAWILNHAWNWSDLNPDAFAGLLDRYGRFLAANSGVGSPFAGLFALLHLNQNSGPAAQVTLTAQYVGPEPALLEQFAQEMRRTLPSPTIAVAEGGYARAAIHDAEIQQMPWLFATQMLNGSGPNSRGKYKSAYMVEPFPDHKVEAMWRHLWKPKHPNPRALVQVDSYGCQVNAVAPDTTAIPQRSSIMKLQFQTYWTSRRQDQQNLDWIGAIYEDMYGPRGPYPDGTVDGCYVNYPDVDLEDWQYLYYKEGYARLRQVKARWDPHDVFHHKQSIEPAR
jgi:FAD/FMN-containing dehydrogenase